MHADHHLGLIRILDKKNKFYDGEPVSLIAPIHLKSWLNYNSIIN